MTYRIHIVGSCARTGTTLMYELITTCFDIDGKVAHEQSIFTPYDYRHSIFCTKHPGERGRIKPLLKTDNRLWIIMLLRDPRDVICSKSHRRSIGKYYTNLGAWRAYGSAAKVMMEHPRFVTVKYEDLVINPNRIQQLLVERMPFLKERYKFSDFHMHAHPSKDASDALGGVRPIDNQSVGVWRGHRARLIEQIRRYGDISDDLVQLNYESDKDWLHELFGDEIDTVITSARNSSADIDWATKLILIRKYLTYWLCRYTPLRTLIYDLRIWKNKGQFTRF